MKKRKILITRHLPGAVQNRAAINYDVVQLQTDKIPSGEELVSLSQGCDAILCCITEKFTRDVIEKLPESIKIISTFSVGTDHIDLEAARDHGIRVGSAPQGVTLATAELAITLLLAAARRASEGEALIKTKSWHGWGPQQLLGRRLYGKKLGIYGMGKIGQAVAKRARGFDMVIHYHNRKRLPLDLEQGAIYHPTLDGLLRESEMLSINAPATPSTKHSINAEAIAKMPDDAIIVNTARGDLIKDDDLIDALVTGKLFAAGLDVFENEPDINTRYYDLDNVFMLPHLGSATLESRIEMGYEALDNIDAVLDGRDPISAVV